MKIKTKSLGCTLNRTRRKNRCQKSCSTAHLTCRYIMITTTYWNHLLRILNEHRHFRKNFTNGLRFPLAKISFHENAIFIFARRENKAKIGTFLQIFAKFLFLENLRLLGNFFENYCETQEQFCKIHDKFCRVKKATSYFWSTIN